ncbi:hypothetical protein ACIHFC_21470 [Streptomyces sp. NPDC052013]|uniref:hypothetical protein n=1 Tax=Streptomyces sp. NPDC052013 TaxID=3365679 RepID=UPI0037D3EA31
MADEQHRWLDRETAERLLSGLPPEAADPAARERAERLARTLGALAPAPLTSEELPGEAAALAAFRKAREERDGRYETHGAGRRTATAAVEAGVVRIGTPRTDAPATARRSRWTRPVRFALAAAVAAGMVGGAAALAGTGVLPGPAGDPGSDPAASVTATAAPNERPLASPESPEGTRGGATPDSGGQPSAGAAGTTRPDGSAAPGDKDPGGGTAKPGADSGDPAARSGRDWKQIAAACRDLRDGKGLDGDRRRMLEGAAGSASRVATYCKGVLATADVGSELPKGAEQDTRERAGEGEREDGGGDEDKDSDRRGHGKHGGGDRHGGKDRKGRHGDGHGNGNGNGRRDTGARNTGARGTDGGDTRAVGAGSRHARVTSAVLDDRLTRPGDPGFSPRQRV